MVMYLLIIAPQVAWIDHLYGGAKFLFMFQPQLPSGNQQHFVLAKLKLMLYYELLHTEDKVYFTLGSLGKISKRSVTEAALMYSAWIMYSFKIFIKNNLNK